MRTIHELSVGERKYLYSEGTFKKVVYSSSGSFKYPLPLEKGQMIEILKKNKKSTRIAICVEYYASFVKLSNGEFVCSPSYRIYTIPISQQIYVNDKLNPSKDSDNQHFAVLCEL